MDKSAGTCLIVKCGNKEAEFFPNKCKKSGKSIGNCIKYKDRWISPPEFESLAGLHGRKWRTNIRYAGKPIGQWLAEHEADPSSQKSEVLQPITCISDVDNNASLSASLSTSLSNPEVTPCPHMGPPVGHTSDTSMTATAIDAAVNSCTHTSDRPTPADLDGEQDGVSLFPDHLAISRELEQSLLESVKGIVKQAMSAMEKKLQDEIKSMFTTIETLIARVTQLEGKLHSQSCPSQGINDNSIQSDIRDTLDPTLSVDQQSTDAQQQLVQLQNQIQSLTTQQIHLEREKEREKRKCNVLLGNVEEKNSESMLELKQCVMNVFKDILQVDSAPVFVTRLGKPQAGRRRLILVKMKSFDEKHSLLKNGKLLNGSGIFLMEDLSKSEREERKGLVSAMKQARKEGKRAYIRFSDGRLIVNGKIHHLIKSPIIKSAVDVCSSPHSVDNNASVNT